MFSDGQRPQLNTVEELPRVYVLDSLLSKAVTDVSHVETELSNVQETQLISLREVKSKNSNEAVLSYPDFVLYLEAASTALALFCELHVHLFDNELKKNSGFFLVLSALSVEQEKSLESLEREHLSCLFHLGI